MGVLSYKNLKLFNERFKVKLVKISKNNIKNEALVRKFLLILKK